MQLGLHKVTALPNAESQQYTVWKLMQNIGTFVGTYPTNCRVQSDRVP